MAVATVTWYANPHEHSLHWIKLGLMRLARAGRIVFRQMPAKLAHGHLPQHWVNHTWRRLVALKISMGTEPGATVLLDGEDSVFQTSHFIVDCDAYFVCAYHRPFFEGHPFGMALPWQTDSEVLPYREKYRKLQRAYAKHLWKGRPLGPIGPDLSMAEHITWLQRKRRNVVHRVCSLVTRTTDWTYEFAMFEKRMAHLTALRQFQPVHDVVLRDSLWGWPRHRVRLHARLGKAASSHDIRTHLTWRRAEPYELGEFELPPSESFPRTHGAGIPLDYERALAQSRLGVFATGFHYGCRNITTLAWFFGLRTYLDPLSFDAGVNLDGLEITTNSGDWPELEQLLGIAAAERPARRKARQEAFDACFAPEALADRMLDAVLEGVRR